MKYKGVVAILFICCVIGCSNNENPVSSGDNSDPQILAVTFSPDIIRAGESCLVNCKATDQDNDNLSYKWNIVGNISGSGSSIFYTPSACCGQPIIEITVEDGKGGSVDTMITVNLAYE
jgi:hypothetical protein